MVTMTIAHSDVLDAVRADLPPGVASEVRLVEWGVRGPLPAGVDPAEVDVVVVPNFAVGAAMFARVTELPALRAIQLPSAGFEHALGHVPPGVVLCNGRGVHDAGTAELALALTLASQRGVVDAVRAMPEGRWEPEVRASLADRRVLVLGAGAIGSAIARRLDAFEAEVVRVARTARDEQGVHVHGVDELDALLPTVDIVIAVLPLSDATHRLVDAGFLARMRDGALLVNVGRGAVVDTDALLAETSSGRLRAALDVTDPEPLPADHPLWHVPGVLITPHLGGNTNATTPRLAALLRRQLGHLVAGEDLENVVARG